MKHISIFIAAMLLLLNGCSVFMAASKKGVDFDELGACKTKSCLISKEGVEPLTVSGLPENTEVYKVLKPQGSTGRAIMHGLLDVATLGVWEVAGTPIEGAYNQDKYYAIRVTYEPGTENIKEIALSQ